MHTNVDLEPSSDSESNTSLSRAQRLANAVAAQLTPTEEPSPHAPVTLSAPLPAPALELEPSALHEPQAKAEDFEQTEVHSFGPYPQCTLGEFDKQSLSCGLMAQYNKYLGDAQDPYQSSKTLNPQPPDLGKPPNFLAILSWVVEQLATDPKIRNCNTLLVLSDTRDLEEIPHWKQTVRWVAGRTRFVGPAKDKWHALFVPSDLFDCHYVWTAVYVLKALTLFLPGTDLVLHDHDAAFVALLENNQLCQLASNLTLPFRVSVKQIGCLVITEPYSPGNAGIVWFPRRKIDLGSSSDFLQAKEMFDLMDTGVEGRQLTVDHVSRLLELRTQALCDRKRLEPPEFPAETWKPPFADNSLGEKNKDQDLRKQTALDWNLEHEYAILNNTPLHRSFAACRDDLILGWALMGDFMHMMFFPSSSLNARDGVRGNLPPELQTRAPSLAKCACKLFLHFNPPMLE